MKQFDYYEFTAILVPGASFIIAIAVIFPEYLEAKYLQGVSVGDLGLFTIAAYVFGHVIQAFSSLYEKAFWWCFGGMPTQWLIRPEKNLITDEQRVQFYKNLKRDFDIADPTKITDMQSISRQIYVRLRNCGQSGRVDIFNANYGLNRAMAASFLIGLITSMFLALEEPMIAVTLFIIGILLTYRMYRFAVNYAQAIVNGYLECKND